MRKNLPPWLQSSSSTPSTARSNDASRVPSATSSRQHGSTLMLPSTAAAASTDGGATESNGASGQPIARPSLSRQASSARSMHSASASASHSPSASPRSTSRPHVSRSPTRLGLSRPPSSAIHSSRSRPGSSAHRAGDPSTPSPSLSLRGESYASSIVLDLHGQKFADLHVIHSKFAPSIDAEDYDEQSSYPWQILLLSDNLLSRLTSLVGCNFQQLRKLDLSRNNIDQLPSMTNMSKKGANNIGAANNFWSMPNLQILFLHQNKIDSIHAVRQLSALPRLEILTLFGNPVEFHPSYRHVVANVCPSLRLLDFYVISDAELIEAASSQSGFGDHERFGIYAKGLACDVINIRPPVLPPIAPITTKYHRPSSTRGSARGGMIDSVRSLERSQLALLESQLSLVRGVHRKGSPVLILQAWFRGVLTRRVLRAWHEAARKVQRWWRNKMAEEEQPETATEQSPSTDKMSPVDGQPASPSDRRQRRRSAFLAAREQSRSQAQSRAFKASVEARTIYLVQTSDVAISLFVHIAQRVAQNERAVAPRLSLSDLVLLSVPSIKDNYPIVRCIPLKQRQTINDRRVGGKLLPGRLCPLSARSSLSILRCRTRGSVLSSSAHRLLCDRVSLDRAEDDPRRLMKFISPNMKFHELLIRAVHAYNIEMGNYADDPSLASPAPPSLASPSDQQERDDLQRELQLGTSATSGQSSNYNKVLIYPGTILHLLTSIVSIQSCWRSYAARKRVQPPIGARLVRKRAAIAIQRWWRTRLFHHRLHFFVGLRRYGSSIQSRHLFCRGDIYDLLRAAPNAFVRHAMMPEHRVLFGIEPRVSMSSIGDAGSSHGEHAEVVDTGVGQVSLFVDDHETDPRKFQPFPQWVARGQWEQPPIPIIRGATDRLDPSPANSLSSRLVEVIEQGVTITLMPDVNAQTYATAGQAVSPRSMQQKQQQQPTSDAVSLPPQSKYSSSTFIKLSFRTTDEARTRALLLALHTWSPTFYLLRRNVLQGPIVDASTPAHRMAGSEVAFLMTPQHMNLCLQHQQAGGACGPSGERHVIYTTFWTRTRVAPPSLYSNQAYLDLQHQLRLIEEAHIAAERIEATAQSGIVLDSKEATNASKLSAHYASDGSSDLEVVGDRGVSSADPRAAASFASKYEQVQLERMQNRMRVAEARVKMQAQLLEQKEHVREQSVMHRIRLSSILAREVDARRNRMAEFAMMDEAQKEVRRRIDQQNRSMREERKQEAEKRKRIKKLDRQMEGAQLRRRLMSEHDELSRLMAERRREEETKVQVKMQQNKQEQEKHRRILDSHSSTLSFLSLQNMIGRHLGSGLRSKLRENAQSRTAELVASRRLAAQQRRQAVHRTLYENFVRRKESAMATKMENQQMMKMRQVKEENKNELKRARRQHMANLRVLASNATAAAGGGNIMNAHASLTRASIHPNNGEHGIASAHPFLTSNAQRTFNSPTPSSQPQYRQHHQHQHQQFPPIRAPSKLPPHTHTHTHTHTLMSHSHSSPYSHSSVSSTMDMGMSVGMGMSGIDGGGDDDGDADIDVDDPTLQLQLAALHQLATNVKQQYQAALAATATSTSTNSDIHSYSHSYTQPHGSKASSSPSGSRSSSNTYFDNISNMSRANQRGSS